jgi:hypothetical protein
LGRGNGKEVVRLDPKMANAALLPEFVFVLPTRPYVFVVKYSAMNRRAVPQRGYGRMNALCKERKKMPDCE